MKFEVVKKRFLKEFSLYENRSSISFFLKICIFVSLVTKIVSGLILTVFLSVASLFKPITILILKKNSRIKASQFIEDLEGYLRHRRYKGELGKNFVLVPFPHEFPSEQLGKMYGRHVFFLRSGHLWLISILEFVWPVLRIERRVAHKPDTNYFKIWNSSPPILNFTDSEKTDGELLSKNLFPKEKPYVMVCIASKLYRQKIDGFDLNTIDRSLTHIAIDQYLPTLNYLSEQGLNIVKFGVHTDEKLPVGFNPNFFDFSAEFRSSFGDVWLNSRCKFLLSGVSGGWWFAAIFNKPSVLTNIPFVSGSSNENDLFIPSMPWMIKEKQFATFEWQIKNRDWSLDFAKLGQDFVAVRNTETQILDVCDEMNQKLNGLWIETEADIALQKKLKAVQAKLNVGERAPARMGAKFLREHQYLLPQ